jgi:mono/diheme cytochrome c family protein
MTRPALAVMLLVSVARAADAPDGKALYESKCTMCHDQQGTPKKMGEGSANLGDPKWQAQNSVEAVVKVITEGKGKMKPYKERLSAEEIAAVAAYVKTLK